METYLHITAWMWRKQLFNEHWTLISWCFSLITHVFIVVIDIQIFNIRLFFCWLLSHNPLGSIDLPDLFSRWDLLVFYSLILSCSDSAPWPRGGATVELAPPPPLAQRPSHWLAESKEATSVRGFVLCPYSDVFLRPLLHRWTWKKAPDDVTHMIITDQ